LVTSFFYLAVSHSCPHSFPTRRSSDLSLHALRDRPVVPFWEDRVKDDRHVFFEGFAHGPSSFIEFISDTDRDREPLLRLRLLAQSQYGLERLKQVALTSSRHVPQQSTDEATDHRAVSRRVG